MCSSYIFINIYVCRPKGHDIKHVDESMLTVQTNNDGPSKNKVAKQNIWVRSYGKISSTMATAKYKHFLIFYLSSSTLLVGYRKRRRWNCICKHIKKNIVNTEIFFLTFFFQEKGGSVGGEPPPPPVVDYLTISCRRRLGRTSNHFV